MRRKWKKLVSLVLAVSMIGALLPVTALAEDVSFDATRHFVDANEYLTEFDEYIKEETLVYDVTPWEELGVDAQTYGLLRSGGAEAKWKIAADADWTEGTFTQAVNGVYVGGTIELLRNVYLTSTVTLQKDMIITSADKSDPKSITCAINGHEYFLNIATGTITLENVAVDGGYNEKDDIKIYGQRALIAVNGGDLVLEEGAEIRNNYNATVQGAGGGVCVINGNVTMNDGSRIYGNYACSSGGVAILQESTNVFTMAGGVVENNTAVTMYTNRTYTNGWKVQIRAGGVGGGFGVSAGELKINGGIIRDNVAQPIDLYQTYTKVEPHETEWYACQGGFGGGIATYSSSNIKPTVNISEGVIKGNDGFYGGGMYIDWGSVTVEDSSICSNTATSKIIREEGATGGYTEDKYGGHGGGVYLSYGSLTLDDCTVCHNEADYYGGGIFQLQGGINSSNKLTAFTEMVIKNSSIVENKADACAGMYISGSNKREWDGSGTWGTTKLIDTEVTKNTAEKKGGGILVAPYQDVTVSGAVKIHNNTAPDHKNFLLDNDIEYAFDPGRVVVEGELAEDAVIYIDVCEHTEPYENVHQLVAVGTDTYTISYKDFEKFESDNELYVTLFDTDKNVYLVPPDHTVTFDSRGGSKVAPVGVMSGDTVPKPTDPTREGYTFVGWYTSAVNGEILGEKYDFAAPVTESFTLYAKWEVIEFEDPDDPDDPDAPIIPDRPSGPSYGKVTLTKVDAEDNDTVLSGVEFALYKENGRLIDVYSTDSDGEITVGKLRPGEYYWVEVSPAAGYVLDATEHEFEIKTHRHTEMTVENERSKVPEYFTQDHYAYVVGYDDGLVHPEWNITRAEVTSIFFRLLDEDVRVAYLTKENNFRDVSENDWFNTAVSTMAAMGIVSGYDGNFYPSQKITRGEFAAMASRFEKNGNSSGGYFADIYDHWAMKEINIAANNGWVLGYEDGTFQPNQYITRAEAMAMVNRVLQRVPEHPADLSARMKMWPDNVDMGKWYYLTVQEATNSHDYERKANGYEYWTELKESPNWNAYS